MKQIFRLFMIASVLSLVVGVLTSCEDMGGALPDERFTVSVIEGKGGGVYNKGTSATVTANDKGDDYDFLGWYVGEELVDKNTTYTFTVTKDITLKATYDYAPYKNLSAKEMDDCINDKNAKFVDLFDTEKGNEWDGWPTTVEKVTDVLSPLDSETALKIAISAARDENGNAISDTALTYGGVWSSINIGLLGQTIDATTIHYLEFDFKLENIQNWVGIRFLDKEGNVSTEKGGDLSYGDYLMISRDGWMHIVFDLAEMFNYDYLLDLNNPLNATQQADLDILEQVCAIRLCFSNSKQDQTKESVVYIDNLHLTDAPFDATDIDKAIQDEINEEQKETNDALSGFVIAENRDNLTFVAGKEYVNGENSKVGYRLYASKDQKGWPNVLLSLSEALDFSEKTYSLDVKFVSGLKWLSYKLYDSNWAQVGDEVGINGSDNNYNTYTLVGKNSDVKYIRFYINAEESQEPVEIYFDNLVEVEKDDPRKDAVKFDANVGGALDLPKAYDGKKVKTVALDVKVLDETGKVAFMIGNWDTYIGYIDVTSEGISGVDGVTSTILEDGYIRITITIDEVYKKNSEKQETAGFADEIKLFYVRGNWTTSGCLVDNIVVTEKTQEELLARPSAISVTAGQDKTIELKAAVDAKKIESISFDILVEGEAEGKVAVMIGNWTNYMGYYNIYQTGITEDGVSFEVLEDGYIRVTVNPQEVKKVNNASQNGYTDEIHFIYVRGNWSTASCKIDNIQTKELDPNALPDRKNATKVTAGSDATVVLKTSVLGKDVATISFDILVEGEGKVAIMIGNWSTYIGYLDIYATGATYTGITSTVLDDGYVRITINPQEVLNLNGGTSESAGFNDEIQFIYVRGNWSQANCSIDNIEVVAK